MSTPTRGIRLYTQLQEHYAAGVVDGFRFTIVAADPVLMPCAIFRYTPAPVGLSALALVGPQSYGAQCPGAQYMGPQYYATGTGVLDGVCSPPDLEEFPIGAPTPGMVPPYYRQNLVDLLFRSRREAEQALAAIREDVARLIRSMNANDELGPPDQTWVGATPSANPDDTTFWL